jgi:hypothetical protein
MHLYNALTVPEDVPGGDKREGIGPSTETFEQSPTLYVTEPKNTGSCAALGLAIAPRLDAWSDSPMTTAEEMLE